MGSTFEIEVWKPLEWKGGQYGYCTYWRGDGLRNAIRFFIKAKREGYGCVTLHWRGDA